MHGYIRSNTYKRTIRYNTRVQHTCVMKQQPGWNNGYIFTILKVTALAVGPYAYMVSVLRETLQHTFSEDDWSNHNLAFMKWALILIMYICGTFIVFTVLVVLVYLKKYDRIIRPCTDKLVARVTNIAYTMVITTLLTHVLGTNEPFLLICVVVTLRIQQTLCNRHLKPHTGLAYVAILIVLASLWSVPVERDTACLLTKENTTNVNHAWIMGLCVILGMATHTHTTQIIETVFDKPNETTMRTLALTWLLHVSFFLSTTIGSVFTSDNIQFFTRVCDSVDKYGFIRLVLTTTSLLLSTAPTKPTNVNVVMVCDTACVCATLIFITKYPAYATIAIITAYTLVMISISVLAPLFITTNSNVYRIMREYPE
jgi:hypothetical protein